MSSTSGYAGNLPGRVPSIRETQKRATRDKLIVSAISVIAERGFQACTMEEIATRARLGRTTMYKYFDNKGELAAAALQAQLTDMVTVITSISQVTPGNAFELSDWLTTFEATFCDQGPWMHRTVPTAEFIEHSLEMQEAAAVRVLEIWAQEGWMPAVAEPSKAMLLLFVLIGRWLSFQWVFGRAEPVHERAALVDLVNAELMRVVRRKPRVAL